MSEYIGSQISLISKSDIRYVGTLHEINSENSTVALENVKSFGTEGRRNGEGELPANDNIYEYIVFRGSDVKDLRIEEAPKETKPAQPPMPNDPAILGAARPPSQAPPNQQQPQGPFGHPPPYSPYAQYPPHLQGGRGFGPPGGFPGGPGGPPGGPGFGGPGGPYGGMPFGAPPPGWYPPPGQGFPPGPGGPFSPHPPPGMGGPGGPPGPHGHTGHHGPGAPSPAPIGPSGQGAEKAKEMDAKPADKVKLPTEAQKQAPPPPVDSKPDAAAALAPPANTAPSASSQPQQGAQHTKSTPSGPKNIVPAIPLRSPNKQAGAPAQAHPSTTTATQHTVSQPQPGQAAANAALNYQNATQAATAAVAAAMAKLPPGPGKQRSAAPAQNQEGGAIEHLTRKVDEMRTNERIRHGGQQGTGGYAAGHRGGGRGRGRRPSAREGTTKPVEVPDADFDFESANAKFNKEDLVKEAIASGSPVGTPNENNGGAENGDLNGHDDVVIPKASADNYDKKSSFFDNISSDLKDRAKESGKFDGRAMRNEERSKNLETFGQGSVDNYRGGFRGRGRGRGFRGRGRGGFERGRGRSEPRGGSTSIQAES